MRGYKVLTSDLRSPVQGGDPIFDGTFPYELPIARLDKSEKDCGAGWNFTDTLEDALKIAGLWPDGRPSRAFIVESSGNAVKRGAKNRSEGLSIISEVTETEIKSAISDMSSVFGEFQAQMTESQMKWRHALSRPSRDEIEVIASLRLALNNRELDWALKKYDNAWNAWNALMAEFASLKKWVDCPSDSLTVGIISACEHGLAIALPTSKNTLGWAMIE